MSSVSVRFNSFSFLYSIFNEHKFQRLPSLKLRTSLRSVLAAVRSEALAVAFTSLDFGCRHCRLVGLDGLEPSTSRLSGVRSNHLSYKPILSLNWYEVLTIFSRFGSRHCRVVEMMGFEPMTPCLQGRCSPS